MKTTILILLVSTMSTFLSCPIVIAQDVRPKSLPKPFATVSQALSAFSVDESASKTGKISQPNSKTVVVGPFELHLPIKQKPGSVDSARTQKFSSAKPAVQQTNQVRTASHQMPTQSEPSMDHLVADDGALPNQVATPMIRDHSITHLDEAYVVGIPSHAHQVIRSPGQPQPVDPSDVRGSQRIHEHAKAIHERHNQTHPPHSSFHRRVQPEPATIPGGREQAIWKQPYSYGYFGASGQRHWTLQHGYRDRYTQWSRR